ncbi:MAG: L,D-transpeptidase [Planctomycetes bacterium]|nr:L,D-transpeptidase [Planctomycetota bacterium]
MRALLLLLLLGGVAWFLVQGFGPSLAKDPEPSGTGGTMLTEDPPERGSDAPLGAASAQQLPAAEPEAKPSEAAPVEVEKPRPAPPAAPETAEKQQESASPAPTHELELAAQLAHQPEGFTAWLASHEAGVSTGRRKLARALSLQLAGRAEEASAIVRELGGSEDLAADERKLLDFWPQGAAFALPPSNGSLLLRAAGLASCEHVAREALDAARYLEAVQAYSQLLTGELASPWPADQARLAEWTAGLDKAQHGYRWNRKAGWPSLDLKVESGDSLIGLRKRALEQRPELTTCTGLIARANELQGETIHPGQLVRVPTGKPRVLVDLSARWLLFLLDDEVLAAWPVGVGKPGSDTPRGSYTVGEKSTDPTWFRPGEAPVPAGDPRNPLGTRWIAWVGSDGEKTHLGFHGTRNPESIGQDESEGCVRMLNRNVEELYQILPRGTPVLVQP